MPEKKSGTPQGSQDRNPEVELVTKGSRTAHVERESFPGRLEPASQTHFRAEFFEGPLPPPDTLAEYDNICPGAASRILAMAESQSQHRQELEKRVVLSNCRSQDRGPIFGFLLAAGVIAIGGYLVLGGKEISGLVALVTALAAVVVPFIYGKRQQKEELEEKRSELRSGEEASGKEIVAGSKKNRPKPH